MANGKENLGILANIVGITSGSIAILTSTAYCFGFVKEALFKHIIIIACFFIVLSLVFGYKKIKEHKYGFHFLMSLDILVLIGAGLYSEHATSSIDELEKQIPNSGFVSNNTTDNQNSSISQEPELVTPSPATIETESPTTNTQDSSVTSLNESKNISSQDGTVGEMSSNITEIEPASTTMQDNSGDDINTIGMEFVRIPAGSFEMGSDEYTNAKPVHRVNIQYDYCISKYEVTQEQWIKLMGERYFTFADDNNPADCISWEDAQKFIMKLNEKEGTDKYRLPSEAEWEYACRAGTTTKYSFGDEKWKIEWYAWCYNDSNTAEPNTYHLVGQKKPNDWGLFDMHGNLEEWVQDDWHYSYDDAPTDGSSWGGGSTNLRVARGGNWAISATDCQSTSRRYHSSTGSITVGFRVVRDV